MWMEPRLTSLQYVDNILLFAVYKWQITQFKNNLSLDIFVKFFLRKLQSVDMEPTIIQETIYHFIRKGLKL